ncbi:MAG: sugar phosphate isomerase/epimerase [Clostridia bacterium]|nr:sugar phosphate isomerase/epimerase [Clostridia bacterium]
MKYNKLSGFSDEIDASIKIQFEAFGRLGISYFEPRGIDGKNISTLTEDEAKELLSKMNEYGIKASSIGSPVGKIDISDDFGEHFEMFKNVVSIAKILGAKYIRIFSFYNKNEWNDETRNEGIKRLRTLIDYAKENDVVLLHENEKDIYGESAKACLELMEELSCDNFKAVFDPANFVQAGEDTNMAYDMLKPYIAYMHIKDSLSNGDIVPAGDGDGNIEYILADLFKNGYDGFVSLEPHLGSFEGLADLELDDKMTKLEKGGEHTFKIAYDALEKIIDKII